MKSTKRHFKRLRLVWGDSLIKTGRCTFKVPNGKLLKVSLVIEGKRIDKVQIRGDFFIHPEESLDELETALKGMEYNIKDITDIVGKFFAQKDFIAFGITPKAVVDAIIKCKEVAE
jgi:lipoate-protein ligase A